MADVATALAPGIVVVEDNGTGPFSETVRSGAHVLAADEPVAKGGNDTGPDPYAYLLAGLGACTAMTLRMYARQKKWPLEKVRVQLQHDKIHAADCESCETKEGKVDRIQRTIELEGPLDDEQRKRLDGNRRPLPRAPHAHVGDPDPDECPLAMKVSEGASRLHAAVETFFNEEVLPRHRDWVAHVARHPGAPPFLAGLRARARELGLWNLWQPDRLSNRDYAPIAEITGRLPWASEVFNGQAPDVPNMIMLQHAATPAQKQRWLEPLLEGRIRSAFGMTEPDVASADATNIATSLRRDGGEWVVNGRKWYITGGAHPDCAFVIVMGVSRPEASRTGRHSCVIVPMETPGLKVVRELALPRLGGQHRSHRRA